MSAATFEHTRRVLGDPCMLTSVILLSRDANPSHPYSESVRKKKESSCSSSVSGCRCRIHALSCCIRSGPGLVRGGLQREEEKEKEKQRSRKWLEQEIPENGYPQLDSEEMMDDSHPPLPTATPLPCRQTRRRRHAVLPSHGSPQARLTLSLHLIGGSHLPACSFLPFLPSYLPACLQSLSPPAAPAPITAPLVNLLAITVSFTQLSQHGLCSFSPWR